MAAQHKQVVKFREKLQPGEEIVDYVQGYVGEMMGSGTNVQVNGVLILTNQRVTFYFKGWFKEVQETIHLDKISSVETTKKMLIQLVKIYTSGNTLEFKSVEPPKAIAMADKILNSLKSRSAHGAVLPSLADELMKIAELHKAGAMTDDEFKNAKAKLIRAG